MNAHWVYPLEIKILLLLLFIIIIIIIGAEGHKHDGASGSSFLKKQVYGFNSGDMDGKC